MAGAVKSGVQHGSTAPCSERTERVRPERPLPVRAVLERETGRRAETDAEEQALVNIRGGESAKPNKIRNP